MTTLNQDLINQVNAVVKSLESHYEGFYQCDCCGGQFDEEEQAEQCCDSRAETQNMYDYLTDILDINYILNSDKTLKGVRLLVCFGGPNVWVDTISGQVEGHWWGDSYSAPISSSVCNELVSVCEELLNC